MSSSRCPHPCHQDSPTGRNSGFPTNDCPAASFRILPPRRTPGSPPTSLPLAASVPAPGVEPGRALPPALPFHATSKGEDQSDTTAAANTPAEASVPQVHEDRNAPTSTSTAPQTAPATDLAGEFSKALDPVMDELNDLNLKIHDLKDLITKQHGERKKQKRVKQSKGIEETGEKQTEEEGWQNMKSQNVKTEKEQQEADMVFRYYDREDKRLTAGDIVLGAAGYCLVYLSLKMAFRIGRGLWNWGSR